MPTSRRGGGASRRSFSFRPGYQEYINSERWKEKSKAHLDRNGRWCRACKISRGPMEVHHRTYDRMGYELPTDLVVLCRTCHRGVHQLHRRSGRRMTLEEATMAYINSKRKR